MTPGRRVDRLRRRVEQRKGKNVGIQGTGMGYERLELDTLNRDVVSETWC